MFLILYDDYAWPVNASFVTMNHLELVGNCCFYMWRAWLLLGFYYWRQGIKEKINWGYSLVKCFGIYKRQENSRRLGWYDEIYAFD
jgi:hypothetical protein